MPNYMTQSLWDFYCCVGKMWLHARRSGLGTDRIVVNLIASREASYSTQYHLWKKIIEILSLCLLLRIIPRLVVMQFMGSPF